MSAARPQDGRKPLDRRTRLVRQLLADPLLFCQHGSGITLRGYQSQPAQAVIDSVLHRRGLTFVVMFPRQSGKNELQAQIEAYLLMLHANRGGEIVKVSPTWKPQSLNAMRRLERVLERNLLTAGRWKKEHGYVYRLGQARMFFLSGAPESHIVGATASLLLEVDEAQDVRPAKYDKDVAPMAASTNATRVLWGTAWTSHSLLARELRAARLAEQADGIRRVFVSDAESVAKEVPAYGRFVAEQTTRLGRSHPMVRTQFFSEEIDAAGGMFPPERLALMMGSHEVRPAPLAGCGRPVALLLDVAGEDEERTAALSLGDGVPRRDATALTLVEVEPPGERGAPLYRCLFRWQWVGVKHTRLYEQIVAIARTWNSRWLVVDATGVGAGLASFLQKALPGRVLPFIFNSASKSRLGWDFLGVVDSGRWQEYQPPESLHAGQECLQRVFWKQAAFCQYEVQPGPEKRMQWGVPDGATDPADGQPVHDDLLLSAALCALLDEQTWGTGGESLVIPGTDPLKKMDRGF